MAHRVLVLAQGDGRRWDDGSGPAFGVRKHLVNVEGETVIGRCVRLFAERGCEVTVVGPDEDGYRLYGADLVTLEQPHVRGMSMDKFFATSHMWNSDGRTTIVWGDCYYTDDAADLIAACDADGVHYFRRTGRSSVTGHPHDESFAVSFVAGAHGDVLAAAERVASEVKRGRIKSDHVFHHYAAYLGHADVRPVSAVLDTPGQTVIDDWTDDFDKPSEYLEWLRRRDARADVSFVVMAHPKRKQWAEHLAAKLDCQIVWDRGQGLWDTAFRCLKAYDPDCSHHVVVQDDAILADGFVDAVRRACAVAGRRPLGLYTGRHRGYSSHIIAGVDDVSRRGGSWFAAEGPKWAVAVAHPVALLDQALAIADGIGWTEADDARMTEAYHTLGVDCWYTVPSLVDHRDGESIVRGTGRTGRRARKFTGDVGSVDFTKGIPRMGGGEPDKDVLGRFENMITGRVVSVRNEQDLAQFRAARRWCEVVDAPPLDVAPVAQVPLEIVHVGGPWFEVAGERVRGREAARRLAEGV